MAKKELEVRGYIRVNGELIDALTLSPEHKEILRKRVEDTMNDYYRTRPEEYLALLKSIENNAKTAGMKS